jgi:hypothetical protein
MTKPKSRSLSIQGIVRWIPFVRNLSFFSIAKESKALAAEEIELEKLKAKERNAEPSATASAVEPSFTGDMRNRKHWWGRRTIKINKKRKSETPRAAPGGGAISGGAAASAEGNKSPMVTAHHDTDVEYDDVEDLAGANGDKDRPRWLKAVWEDLKVGDFVRLKGDDSVPAGTFPFLDMTQEQIV